MNGSNRILLVEDTPAWQQGVRALLATNARFELIGVADCYEDAMRLFDEMQPDVALLDWQIRGERDGLAVGQAFLSRDLPLERIIMMSSSASSSLPTHPFLFVPKARLVDELLPLLESVTAR